MSDRMAINKCGHGSWVQKDVECWQATKFILWN